MKFAVIDVFVPDDKLALSIRHMPVPDVVKTRSGGATTDECVMDEDNEDTMDSSASTGSGVPTSNLVPTDLLMRKHNVVRFSEAVLPSDQNNEGAISIDDYIKDNKTLNVNVLADEVGCCYCPLKNECRQLSEFKHNIVHFHWHITHDGYFKSMNLYEVPIYFLILHAMLA